MDPRPPSPLARRPVLHPRAHEEWFRALPHERRARMNREWRAGLAHDRELAALGRGRLWTSAWKQAAVFALCDGFCAGNGWGTLLLAVLAGGALGALLRAASADRLVSGAAGGFAFVAAQWLSRGVLSVSALFWIVPAAYFSAYLGLEREE